MAVQFSESFKIPVWINAPRLFLAVVNNGNYHLTEKTQGSRFMDLPFTPLLVL